MPIQFAGSSSTGDRRRRRLAVNGDGISLETTSLGAERGRIQSQLVASSAAAPWVPVSELRIWIYAGIVGVLLLGLTVAMTRPLPFRPVLNPFVELLLSGERPRLLVVVSTLFLALSTQLGLLITWYRSQCKLDFSGRYRVWPWAAGLLGVGTLTVATGLQRVVGQVFGPMLGFAWQSETVAWLLPLCVVMLPMTLLLDRELRRSRSSLYTLRLAGALWYVAAWLELFRGELANVSGFGVVRQVLPMFASGTLFLGLWLHARIVAYVCPDPPELAEPSAGSVLWKAAVWCASRLKFWKRRSAVAAVDEDEVEKPKRRRKKVEVEEATAPKRKRKAPAKRAAPKTRAKVKQPEYEEEVEEQEEQVDASAYESYEESEGDGSAYEESAAEESWSEPEADQSEEWVEEEAEAAAEVESSAFVESHKSHGNKAPAPHFSQPVSQQEEDYSESADHSSYQSSESYESSDSGGHDSGVHDGSGYAGGGEEDDEDSGGGLTADQMKGLSKKQKRELKRQQREKQRGRG
ncbi:hypothetical protein [Schlesneria sp. T3-172]|uniref:hypothetical protein n=1 Tax=Schlesneria sphaerica TaxID=3373610 RepID=UPI0037C57B32